MQQKIASNPSNGIPEVSVLRGRDRAKILNLAQYNSIKKLKIKLWLNMALFIFTIIALSSPAFIFHKDIGPDLPVRTKLLILMMNAVFIVAISGPVAGWFEKNDLKIRIAIEHKKNPQKRHLSWTY